jgi:hypothetical protein
MRRLTLLLCAAPLVLGACGGNGFRILSGEPVASPTPLDQVLLYGVDRAPATAPEGCTELGRVEAWSPGEKNFPFGPFREAAAALGGNGVHRFRPNAGDKRYSVFQGVVLRCPRGPSSPR